MRTNRQLNLLQVATSTGCLLAGGLSWIAGWRDIAAWTWMAGAAFVLAVVAVDTVVTLSQRKFGLDPLAAVAIAGALALHEYLTAAVIAVMFASGRALEDHAERRARAEMTALLSKAPRFGNRYENGSVLRVALSDIRPGDRLAVRPGETIPVDGTLLSRAVVDESSLTGEALPVSYLPGRSLGSGIVNAGDAFDLLATSTAQDSTFTSIVRLVQAAQASKAPAARLADRFALLFVPLVLVLAGLSWLLSADPGRALAVLVVATPCPLILAVPVAIVSAMSRCAQRGVLIKHGGALEKMALVKTIFFDKTGTLTGGKARLLAITNDPAMAPNDVLRLAASLEQMSGHAIAQAVVAAAIERGLGLSIPRDVRETPGAGLSGSVEGKAVRVGGLDHVLGGRDAPPWSAEATRRIAYEGAAGVYVAVDGQLCGVLHMADAIRTESPRALRLLRRAGVGRVVMLTGDRREIALTIGHSLGVDSVIAEQSPGAKLAAIAQARAQGVTMMVGDGINDAPALAAADIGVAMGARGAAAAAESAQVVLIVDRLDQLVFAVRMAQQTRTIALQSVVAGMGMSLLAMVAAAFGYLPPVAGAVLQELIDVAVILNALRVLRLQKDAPDSRLSASEFETLKNEHARLLPVIDRIGSLANRLDATPPALVGQELAALNELLHGQILPHELKDEGALYPHLASMIGGDDPIAPMSSTHREIYRLARVLERLSESAPGEARQAAFTQELRGTLYALHSILRLHFAQEEEIYHNLSI